MSPLLTTEDTNTDRRKPGFYKISENPAEEYLPLPVGLSSGVCEFRGTYVAGCFGVCFCVPYRRRDTQIRSYGLAGCLSLSLGKCTTLRWPATLKQAAVKEHTEGPVIYLFVPSWWVDLRSRTRQKTQLCSWRSWRCRMLPAGRAATAREVP